MIKAKLNLSLLSALFAVLCVPAAAGAAAVNATPAIPWPGVSVRLEASGFQSRARGIASLSGARSVGFRVDQSGRARVVMAVSRSARPGRHTLRVQAGGRSVSTALSFVGSRRASSTMVALSGGQRVLLDPASGRTGGRFTIRAAGFSSRSTLDVRFGGKGVARKRPSSSGDLTIVGSVPKLPPGSQVVRVVSASTVAVLRFQVLSPLTTPPPSPPPPPPPLLRPPPPDTTPPAVSVSAPASGATLSGNSVSVTATATDNVSVSGVQFRLDGKDLGAEDTSAPYFTAWNTTSVSEGSHTLTAVARDPAGNTATSSPVSVAADNTPPTVSITAPSSGAPLEASVAVTATASDSVGVSGVQFRVDGKDLGAEDTSAPYSVTWDTAGVSNAGHTLTAVARDGAGYTTTSSPVSVTVTGIRKIVAAGDIACSPNDPMFNRGLGTSSRCAQRATSDLLVGRGYSDVLTLGDVQYDCATAADFAGSFQPTWGRVKDIIRPATGNHEYKSMNPDDYGVAGCRADAEDYFGYFGGAAGEPGRGYYSFDIGSWHVISLNTNLATSTGCPVISCALGSPQEQWLRADLAAHPTACTLALWHHPLFSSKTPSMAPRPFWDDLYAAGADIVLNGHVHNYERFNPQRPDGTADPAGIAEFIVGTGGMSLEASGSPAAANSAAQAKAFGVLELTLEPNGYGYRFLTAAGQPAFTDAGHAACH